MCSGVDYQWQGRRIRAYVSNRLAMLPVLLRSGNAGCCPGAGMKGKQDIYLLVDGRGRKRYVGASGPGGIHGQSCLMSIAGWNTTTIETSTGTTYGRASLFRGLSRMPKMSSE